MNTQRSNSHADTLFDVWEVRDQNWRKPHYPAYPVSINKIGCATDLLGAERIIRHAVEIEKDDSSGISRIHSFRIAEVAAGTYFPEWKSLSEYIYDHQGKRLDCRLYPYEDGIFHGRSADQVRFGEGELCEVLMPDNRIHLGYVLETPPTVEQAKRANAGLFHMEALDDCYIVLTSAYYADHDHIDSLHVYKPRYKISPQTERRLRKAYNDIKTFPMRMAIADKTARAQLEEAAESLGWDMRIEQPRWKDDSFKLLIHGVPGYPEGLDLQIRQQTAWQHMDRIRSTFNRLAGRPSDGRGYRLKRIVPPPPLIKGIFEPEPSRYRL